MLGNNELVFELKGRLPQHLPLKRMAAYMSEFAILIGDKGDALFSGVREGSICIAAKPALGQSVGQHRERVVRASRGEGPRDRQAAYQKLCQMAADDGMPARIKTQAATVLYFPPPKVQKSPLKVRDYGIVTGELSGIVKDKKAGVKARIRPLDGGPLVFCSAPEDVGRELGGLFLRCVRIYGVGWWSRGKDGVWSCESMDIKRAHKVESASINEAVKAIREVDIEWLDDPLDFEEDAQSA